MKSKLTWMLTLIVLAVAMPGVSIAGPSKTKVEAKAEDKPDKKLTEEEKKAEAGEQAIEWIVGVISKVAPPGRKIWIGKEGQETKEEALKRYRDIAKDLIEIVFNPDTKPIFSGTTGRTRTATLMMGIMLHESGFGKHIDYNIGKYARGDNGNSWCMMQMNVGKGRAWKNAGGWNIKHERPWRYGDKAEDIVEGASGPEMIEDRRRCFTEGLRLIRLSFHTCRNRPFKHRLNIYASGRCSAGSKGSKIRINSGIKMYVQSKADRKFADADLVENTRRLLKKRAEDKAKALAAKKKAEAEKAKAESDKSGKDDKKAKAESTTGSKRVADRRE